MSCITDDCVSFTLNYMKCKNFGSINYILAAYLKMNNIKVSRVDVRIDTDFNTRYSYQCHKIISGAMRDLEKKGYLKRFSKVSWNKIKEIPPNVKISIDVRLINSMNRIIGEM